MPLSSTGMQRGMSRLWVVWRRWSLWGMLAVLVLAVLGTLVWLAGRYEISQVQSQLERDAADAGNDIRSALAHNVQSMLALNRVGETPASWAEHAQQVLRERRELMRLEWRDSALRVRAQADTPYRTFPFGGLEQPSSFADQSLTCSHARRIRGPSYSSSYFLPHANETTGMEVIVMCLPLVGAADRITGYVLATYSLQEVLASVVGHQLTRGQEVSLTEVDGTRLAVHGVSRRGTRLFTARYVLDLPGNTMVLRMDSWHGVPNLFPNVLTALVTAMSIALVSVLLLLAKDTRRRLRAERDLADALAFRKAMEDSLVTGLRARDLQGHITYVNPAFCQMVGFSAQELMAPSAIQSYWPPESVHEYEQRQQVRFAGHAPPREGLETVFMRKDGTRFPVLVIEAPLINAHNMHTGWMSAVLDLSEQRRIEELSRASQERLQATARLATVGEMASLLSHELNQPLAAISSYATGSMNLLRDRPHAPADAGPVVTQEVHSLLQTAMQRIAEQAERAGRVIKSVHDFIRRREQQHERVHPQDLLDAIMPLVILQARKLDVRVRTVLVPGLPALYCDRTMVEQVLLNLARNGMQAMDHPGAQQRELVLRVGRGACHARGRWLEFSVTDQGVGISEEVAQQLFTPFFTTKQEGMGLGLSLCRTVIEQHGGILRYAPNVPQGTIFTFTLPVREIGGSE